MRSTALARGPSLTFTSPAASGTLGEIGMKKARRSWWMVLTILAVCLLVYPINTFAIRLGLLFCISGAWLGALWAFRKIRPVACGLVVVALLICGFLLCPGRACDPGTLREAYLASLRSYEGTHYLWGGENGLGI